MNDNSRFEGKFGSTYDIFYEAVPWHEEFQDKVPLALKNSISNNLQFIEGGFGTGITTKKVLENIPCTVTAIDSEPLMLQKAEEYLGTKLSSRVQFKIGDLLQELKKLPDNAYDGFYSGYVLHNIPQIIRKEVFKEISRVLKPGAIYVNADKIAYDEQKIQTKELALQLTKLNIFIDKYNDSEYYLDWVKHYLRDEEDDLIFREKEQIQCLRDNGFIKIKSEFRKGLECVYSATKQ